MFVNIFHVTSSGGSTTEGYSISIPCTIRSSNGSDISFGTISLYGDTVIDNVSLTSSAPNNNHGDGSDRGIFANGHRLILGTGIGTGAASFKSAPQVFGGGTSSVEDAVETRKSIVSADAELSRTVDLGTFVIVHSGTYYNIVGGGANSDIGSERLPLSTYVVLKGGMSLDTVVGGSGAGGSVYGSAVHTWENGPDQGGTYIYSTGFRMPGDSYHESKVGTDYIPDGMWLEESTIMEGGVSGRDSNNYSDPTYVYGSTHIFLSGDTDIWDVQAGSRRAFSHVDFAYLEISGNAVVRHVACGTITDGNRQSSSQSSPMPVTSVDATKIVVTGNAWVASVFGAGYDTWYLPEATTMAEGERIDVQIKGGTVGSVYGGGYRGTITVGGPDDTRVDDGVFVEISGGTVLGDVYGGGRGGLDKVTHSSGGGINSEGYRDSTGHSVVIGDVFVIVSGGTVKGSVYGGGESVPKLSSYSGVNATFSASDPDMAAVDGDTNVLVNGGTVEGSVYGGGKGVLMHNGQPYDAPMEVPAIVGTAGSYSYQDILWKSGGGAVYDSSVDYTGYARVTGSTAVVIMGGTVKGDIYGGAEIGRVNATANVQVLGHYPVSIQGSVYGGGEGHNQYPALGAVSNTSVRIADAEVTGSVYGGGAYGMVMSIDGVRGTADVDVEASVVHGDVYGGGQGVEAIADSGRVGTVVLDISKGSTVDGSVYGGGQYGASDTIGVTVTGSTVGGSIYGGGLGTASRTSVFGNVALTVDSTTVTGNIYGGSAYGLVEGNIAVELRGGTAATTVYGGGLGTTGNLSAKGNRTVRLEGATVTGSVYGGSQNGNDGAADPDGYTFVVILSAEIGGSVFGGGYRGITWDHTYVYIGCTESETPHEGTVTIGQSVYGGGDVGDVSVGDALFDTTLVYGNSELIVDGSSCTINFNGSLFGEGNSCLTEGDTTIHITDASLRMMSVQRADAVCITSSEIHLEGRNSGTSSSASEKFSFYSVGRLDLVGGTQIYLSSPLGETGDFHSLATPSVPTTQTAPLNTVYVEVGTIFSLQNSEGFGKVYGYTVLSLLASETYYGAFAYGSVDSVGGFVTDDEGLYRTLQYSDLSSPECRYWYIPGVVSQTGSAVLKYDPDIGEGALVSDELKLDIPMTSSGTSLLYGGGYFTSATADAFRLVSGDPTEYGSLSVLMGYAGEGLTSFNNGTGLYVPDRSSETTYVVLEDAGGPDSPRIGVKVSGINPMLSGYAGTVTIQFREVMVADSPEGETNYVYFNAIDVSIAIYIEGHDHPHEGSSTIDIIAGSGQSSFVIPALGDEGDLYVTDARFNGGSLEGAPALTIAGVNNHEGSMGWTGGGFEHVLTVGSESAYLGKFTGMFPSTIQFSMEGFEGTDCSFAIDFEVRVTNGETYQFTMTVKVVTHGPVTVTFVDSRQNVSIPMQFGYGTTITASDGPQVMGNFIGWYNDETFTSQFNFNSPLIRDITLYARYMYTVTFDEMYDGRTSTYYVPMGEPFTIDNYGGKDPVRPGYEFTGWYKDRDCLVLWDFKNDKVEGDITLYAGWQPRGVILDFHNEDGDVILTLGAGDGERIRLDDLFGPYLEQAVVAFGTVPEGGTLVWYVSVSGTGIPVYADNTIEQSMVTVEGGGWHVKIHADVLYNSITVVQDAQDYGSTVVPPKEFAVGPEGGYYTFTPTGADRVGYELSGWIIEATSQEYAPGVTIKIPASKVSEYLSGDGKLHLVAQWRALTYEVVVMKPAGGSVTATLISSDGSTSSGREHTSYISFSANYGDRLSLSYVSEGGYTFEGWVVSKAGAIDDASKQSTYMTVRGDSRVEVRVGGLESAVIRLSVDGAAPGGSITLTGDGRTYTVRQSSVDGEYGVFSVSALLGEYALSYGGSGFGNITVVSGGVSGSYRLVSLALEVTPGADVGTLPSYAVPGTQLTLDVPHGYSVSKLTLRYDGTDHDMGAVSGFTVPSAQGTGVIVKVGLETSNYTIEFVVDFTGPDGSKVVFDKVASITVEYSPEGTVYPKLPWVQLNGLDLNALDRETTSPYSFLGWYLDEGFMQRVQAGDAFPEEDVVLHASIADRKEIIYVVKVYMMGIGGGYPDLATPTYEIQTIELENQFVGWRPGYPGFAVDAEKSSDYEKTVVEAGMDDLYIYMERASGTAVLDPVGGTVSESGGWMLDGEGKLTRKVWYGETVTLPVPVKTENVFGGWSVDGSTVTQVTVGDGMLDKAANAVSFEGTAQWTVNEYRLVLSTLYGTFFNDQTTMTVSVPYGTPLSEVLDGHRAKLEEEAGMYAVFVGWSPAPPETMPADTLTLTAQWTPKEVSITVIGDEHVTISVTGSSLTWSDGIYKSVFNGSIDLMLSFDSGYSLKKATGAKEQPVRKSAVQFEWTVPLNSVNVTVGDGDTLSLTLIVDSVESAVTVTYVINGTPVASLFQNVPSGEDVALHNLSGLSGLTFKGWYSDPNMKPSDLIEGNIIPSANADDREVVYGSLTADTPTVHITAGDLVLDNGEYVGTYNGGRHTLTAVPDTYAEGPTALDYDLTYRIIWGDAENRTISFIDADEYSVTLKVTAILAIGGTVSDVSEAHTKEFAIRIDRLDLSEAEIVISSDIEFTYDGTAKTPTFTVIYNGHTIQTSDYSFSYGENINAGADAGSITVTASSDNCTGGQTVKFDIARAQLPDDGWSVDGEYVYSGSTHQVTIAHTGLVQNRDFTVSSEDADAGPATATVIGIGNYVGETTVGFQIAKKEVTIQWGSDSTFTYNGSNRAPEFTVVSGIGSIAVTAVSEIRQNGTVAGSHSDAGDYVIVITGLDNSNFSLPSDGLTKEFRISKKEIEVHIDTTVPMKYNGQEQTAVLDGGWTEYVVDRDAGKVTVSLGDGKTATNAGTYSVTVVLTDGSGNYELSATALQWSIAPKEVTPHLEKEGFTYSGESHTVTVIVPGILNDEASVRIVEGGSGTAPGSYTVRFSLEGEGKDNYALTATELTWSIGKLSLGTAVVEITGEYTYTGSEIEPEMTVTVNGLTLAESDYDVSYSDNINAGRVNVTVTAKDTSFFIGEAHSTFEIKKKAVSVSVSETGFTYDGNEHTVTVKLSETIEDIILVTEGDLKGTAAGSYTVRLSLGGEGSGNYVLDTEGFTWTISKRSLQDADVSLKGDLTYTGSQIRPGATVTIGELVLEEGKDYEVSYGDNRNVSDGGIVKIAAVGNGNFVGEKTIGFNILRKEVDVSLSSNSFVYDGYEKTVTVGHEGIVDNGVSVVPVDGSILSATQAGTYTVNLSLSGEGSGNYRLSENSLTWTIGKLNLGGSGADIDIDGDFVYCASQIRPVVTVTVGDTVLEEGIDYGVAYGENIFAGQGSVTVTALDGGSLAGSRTIGFTIEKRTVHVILGETSFEYSGSEHTVSVSVNRSDILNDEVRLVTEGTLSATDAGTYTVKLSLAGEREDNYVLSIEGFIWVIGGKSISDADVDVSDEMYTGSGIIPDVKVVVDGITLVEDADYTLSYQNNINAGEGYVTITAKGNFEGSITVPFDIARKALGVSLVEDSFVYDGKEHSVVLDHISGIAAGDVVNVSLDGITRATHAGEYHVDVVMTGADSGNYYLQTTALTWIIEKRGLHDATVSLDDGSTYTYTGSQIMPDVTVSVGGLSPVAGADYAVSYFDNINAGIGTVIITATEDGDYEGTVRVNFAISKKVLEPVLSEGSFVYDGEEHTAELGDLSVSIAQGDDLNVYLKGTVSATDAGTYHVEVAMEGSDAGNYSLKATAFTWIIEKADLGFAHVTVPDGLIHTGSAVEPDVLVEFGGMTLVAGRDYTLSYADNYDAGTAYVTVTAVEDGNFEGSLTVGFDIGRAHLDLVDIADLDDAVYHGSAHTPEISAEYNGSELIEGMHYTVEYHDNIEAGTATVVLRAVDGSNFTGYRHLTFDISPASVDGFGIGDVDDRVYTGSPIEPGISAVFNGAPLTEWEDYELRYADNTDAGTAVIIIEGRGNFSGVREIGFMIVPASMEDVSIAPVPDQMYTGAEVRPGITATLNGVPLVEVEDYILSYVGDTVNVTGDCVYVVAEGIGNLTGTVSIPYRIVYDGLQDITGITVNGYTGVYDGSEHIAVTVIGTMQGDKVSYSTDGTTFVSDVPTVTHVSDSGVVWVKVERPGCVPTMFGVSVTVAPAGLTVESSSVQGMYDGEPLTGNEVTVVNGQLFGDDGFIWVFTGQQTAPGSSANTFVPAALPGTEAGDYIITLVYGTLTVDQSAISESSSWVLAFILAIGIAAASYHGIMWVSGGRPLEALSALASRLASAIRRE